MQQLLATTLKLYCTFVRKIVKMQQYRFLRFLFSSLVCILACGCTTVPDKLQSAERLMETAPDSALHILQHIHAHKLYSTSDKALYALLMCQAQNKNNITVESDSLIKIATDFYTEKDPERAGYAWLYRARIAANRGDADEQANNLLKAQAFAQITENYKLQGLVFNDKGGLYQSQRQYDSMIHYYRLSFQVFQRSEFTQNTIISLINLGYGYLFISKPDSAIRIYRLAEKLALPLHDTLMISSIYKSLGSAYFQQNNFQQALYYYRLAPITHIRIYDSNKWYLLAKAYIKTGELDSARNYLSRVNELQQQAPDYYRLWQMLYEKEGNLKEALCAANSIIRVKDSLNERKLSISFAGLEKKYKFQGLQLENQQLAIQNKQKGIFLLFILFAGSIFVMIVLFWRLRVKKKQFDVQNELLEKEKAFVEIEKDKVEKEKENSALLEKQMKLQSIILLNIEQHRKNSVQQPGLWKNDSSEKNAGHKNTLYEEVIASMNLEYNDISLRLSNDFPALSKRDIFICCLLLAGFDTGMIATILDVKLESITKHRYRLRTKLHLQSSDNLVDYLRQF